MMNRDDKPMTSGIRSEGLGAREETCSQLKPGVGGPTGNLGPRPLVMESGWSGLR